MASLRVRVVLGLLVLLLLVLALVWAMRTRMEKEVSLAPVSAGLEDGHTALRREIRRSFEATAADINGRAPVAVDPVTTLEGMEVGEGPSITYRYRLASSELSAADRLEAESAVRERVCSEPEMRDYMPYGIHYDYVYMGSEGRELLRLRVDEESCLRLERGGAAKGDR